MLSQRGWYLDFRISTGRDESTAFLLWQVMLHLQFTCKKQVKTRINDSEKVYKFLADHKYLSFGTMYMIFHSFAANEW